MKLPSCTKVIPCVVVVDSAGWKLCRRRVASQVVQAADQVVSVLSYNVDEAHVLRVPRRSPEGATSAHDDGSRETCLAEGTNQEGQP